MLRILTLLFLLQLGRSAMPQEGSKPNGDSICAKNTAVNTNCHFRKGLPEPSFPDDGKLRLFGMRFCPYCHRLHLVLTAKNISYNFAYINHDDKPEWYFKLNPNGKLPALQLINEPNQPFLIESMRIAEYLDEKYPEVKLYPEDPLEKAQTKSWIDRFSTFEDVYGRLVYKKNEEDVQDSLLNQIYTEIGHFEAELKKRGTKYFGGAKPCIFDYAIWPRFERLGILSAIVGEKYNFDERFPKLAQWVQLMKEDSAVQKFFLSTDVHKKYVQSVRDGHPIFNFLVEES
ncbi:pyrimidodiazepine synthase-like [Contarinia nasturtii]|uniref:pyrimidodiazepine synthase-like n=1 Tax=Contarinia nasturtii TaxID=265458 RepID=UPI0012D47B4A|nr:pyrimidodiazepine synthase-like [Contarinia nasturtii]